MKLELYNPSIIKDAFDTVGRIIDECKLTFTSEGLSIHALDKSHITFISLEFKRTLFDTYEFRESENVIIDTQQLNNILKRCRNDDILTMYTDESNLILNFKGEAEKEFSIRLIDSEYETPVPPRLEYPVSINVPSSLINESLGDAKVYAENVKFQVDQDYLHIRTDDGTFGDVHSKYIHGENVNTAVQSKFSIEMLMNIFKAAKLSKTCELGLGEDMPLTVKFILPADDGLVEFLLAPRLETD